MNAQSPFQPTIALIPAFNEERFIGSIVLAARAYVDLVVVIDDGSTDQTAAIACKAGATIVQHQQNQGKSAAVNTGFAHVRGLNPRAVVMLDGDGQHCAGDIPGVLGPICRGEADIVVGSRFLNVRSAIPAYRQVGQHGLTMITNLASGVRVSDSQSGFRAFSRTALETLSFTRDGGFSIESEMQFQIREHALRVVEAPINVIYAEKAKRNPIAQGLQVLKGIAGMVRQTRPVLFCGAAGSILLCFSLIWGWSLLNLYTAQQIIDPVAGVMTILLSVLGIVVLFAGFVLQATRSMLLRLQTALVDRIGRDQPATTRSVVIEAQPREQWREEALARTRA
jgi:hypothetical protein